MADGLYDKRDICLIGIDNLGLYFTDEAPSGGGVITIVLTTASGEPDGARVQISSGVPIGGQMTLEEFQLAHFASALDLLKRIAKETPESLRNRWIELMNRNEA